MGPDLSTLEGVVAVIIALITLVGVLGVTQIIVRALERARSPRALLGRRLARGEISAEEYFELESALRSGEPARPPRRRLSVRAERRGSF
jgi:uncharacterized membrane protein